MFLTLKYSVSFMHSNIFSSIRSPRIMAHRPCLKLILDPPQYLHINSLCRLKPSLPSLKLSNGSPNLSPKLPPLLSAKHSPKPSYQVPEKPSEVPVQINAPDLEQKGPQMRLKALITQETSPSNSASDKDSPKYDALVGKSQSLEINSFNRILPLSKFSRTNIPSSQGSSSNLNYDDDDLLSISNASIEPEARTYDIKNLFDITLKLRKVIIKSNPEKGQNYPLLAKIEAKEPPNFKKSPVDVVCVIDKSGSMNGEKLNHVKKALYSIMDLLDENDRLSVVSFSDIGNRVTHLQCMSPENKIKTRSEIKKMKAEGLTNIADGMEHALRILKSRRTVNQISGIFLLSDGLDKTALTAVKELVSNSRINDSFSIHTFGFGYDHDSELMTQIADLKQGNFYFIEDLKLVDQAFLNCLGSLAYSFATDGDITVIPHHPSVLDEGIKISRPLGDPAIWKRNDDNSFTAKIGHLMANKPWNFVLKIKVPKNNKELRTDREKLIDVAKVIFSFKDLKGNYHQIEKFLSVHLLNASESGPKFKDDREVLVQYYRTKGYEILMQAKRLADSFEHKNALDLLMNFRLELELCIVRKTTVIQGLIKDIVNAQNDVAPKNFQFFGKHNLISRARAQGQEKYSFQSSHKYSSPGQEKYQFYADSYQDLL